MAIYDVVIIGGGIVGLSTAWNVLGEKPSLRVAVLEKESQVSYHQSGRNSGVIHSGIYYKPGSDKATNCRRGKTMLEAFCSSRGISFEQCGKVIVATEERELSGLYALHERGKKNGIDCELIGPERLCEIEPHVRGIKAIHVGEAGIVHYPEVCDVLAREIQERGGRILLNAPFLRAARMQGNWIIETPVGDYETKKIINCAGVYSDRVARQCGAKLETQIVPFRGEYFELKGASASLVKGLVYPVPDPELPFLGVHATRMMKGGVEVGPNAVLAFGREGYSFFSLSPFDLLEAVLFPGFRKLILKHWNTALFEMYRSLSKGAFVRAVQRLIPEVQESDLEPRPPGIRAQALHSDGSLVDDFVVSFGKNAVHVINAPSPAATAALSIGRVIAVTALGGFNTASEEELRARLGPTEQKVLG